VGEAAATPPRSTAGARAATTGSPVGSSAAILRASLKVARRTRLNDTNVPFRLYDAPLAAATARRVPPDFNLANIAMALLLEPAGFEEVPIHFRDRIGGHPTVRLWGFVPKALRLHRDIFRLGH
jgi:hypothetical protein